MRFYAVGCLKAQVMGIIVLRHRLITALLSAGDHLPYIGTLLSLIDDRLGTCIDSIKASISKLNSITVSSSMLFFFLTGRISWKVKLSDRVAMIDMGMSDSDM